MKSFWGIIKINFQLSIQNNLLLSILYLWMVSIMRGIENLNEVRAAECLEQSVILIGILLIVPLYTAEQEAVIREVVFTRKIPQWMILFLRILMVLLILVILTGIFAGAMKMKNGTFPYFTYLIGTVISEMALGSIGFFVTVISDSAIAGYLVSMGYFMLNYLGNLSNTSVFCLFSMETGNYTTKIWLFGISIFIFAFAIVILTYWRQISKLDCFGYGFYGRRNS